MKFSLHRPLFPHSKSERSLTRLVACVCLLPTTSSALFSHTVNLNDMWREAKAPNGRIYYYKKSTRETTWTKPASYIPLGGNAPISSGPSAAQTPATATTATSSTYRSIVCIPYPDTCLSCLSRTCVSVRGSAFSLFSLRLPSLTPSPICLPALVLVTRCSHVPSLPQQTVHFTMLGCSLSFVWDCVASRTQF